MRLTELVAWFGLRNVSRGLVLAQFAELQRQVPLLYALLAVNAVAVAYTHHGLAPFWSTVLVPGALVLASVIRLFVWVARRGRTIEAKDARKQLGMTVTLAAVLAAGYVAWALNLNQFGGPYEHAHVAIFIAITVIGCILCLANLPQAAVIVTVIVTVPYLAVYLSMGETVFVAVGLNILLVTGVMLQVVFNNFAGFKQLILSKGETERLSRENLRMAHTDPLTNLPNRRQFFNELERRIEQAADAGAVLSVGLIDLDRFKPINDTYGHVVGDRLLEAIGERLSSAAGADMTVARLGGDEFAFLAGVDALEAKAIAMRICAMIEEPFEMGSLSVTIGASCGIAAYPDAGQGAHELYDRADYVLYTSKASNRGGVTIYSADHETRIQSDRAVEATMRTIDLDAEMSVVFQPILDGASDRIVSVEALGRWASPVLGDVRPDVFVTVAERAGLIHDLTLVLFRKALSVATTLPQDIKLSFNLSAHDVTNSGTILALVTLVRKADIDPSRLIFELTETAVIRDFKAAEAAIQLLRSLGAEVALDDFGTGYSSLSHLHRLPIDRVKIDRSFMSDYASPSGRNLLQSIRVLCSAMELKCTAEGVECAEQVAVLKELGYRYFQGYYFARPMPADALKALVAGEGSVAAGSAA
ncbi:putative bifunctional diguanylate cyclase/phosphodiesterase [Jiella marina]|uniref:putative bifunctional diguanylate cyclase/phosphodiesterase n=1 Tax=Jiella sp. LLJ827 TaxID=2917712 RepID=UPI0021016249|nr:EAL domain-containing protein [Jiella sp. LLJ827]MCQ0988973.1 EAL domain-containing protein [Jiella sp. LLJ827]